MQGIKTIIVNTNDRVNKRKTFNSKDLEFIHIISHLPTIIFNQHIQMTSNHTNINEKNKTIK